MTDYISKQKAIEEIKAFQAQITIMSSADWENGMMEGFDHAIDVIELMDTVDAEPVRHGKWLPESADIPSICSVCDEDWDSFVFGDGLWYHGNLPKYCPHCGAKMDEEREEE